MALYDVIIFGDVEADSREEAMRLVGQQIPGGSDKPFGTIAYRVDLHELGIAGATWESMQEHQAVAQ